MGRRDGEDLSREILAENIPFDADYLDFFFHFKE
jgi:hypothetical protein